MKRFLIHLNGFGLSQSGLQSGLGAFTLAGGENRVVVVRKIVQVWRVQYWESHVKLGPGQDPRVNRT